MILFPDDLEIDTFFRFDGEANPEHQSIFYTISSPKFGTKGLLVKGYEVSKNEITNALISKLKTHQ